MILIEDSYIQLISLYFKTINKRKNKFYIVYSDKIPNKFFIFLVKFLNLFSFNIFLIKSIQFFRDDYKFISDQNSINKICDCYDNLFKKKKRLGGQIFLENILRYKIWKKVAKDEIFKYFYYKKDLRFKDKNFDKIYFLIKDIRKFEIKFYFRFTSFRVTISYLIFILREIVKAKFLYLLRSNKSHKEILNSFSVHEFFYDNEKQEQKLIIDSIKKLSQDLGIENTVEERKLIPIIISNIANKINLKDFTIILNLFIINLFDFFSSNRYLIKVSKSLDYLSDFYVRKLQVSDKFKILAIDPIQGRSIPFLSSLSRNGFEIFFTSFSLGNFFTRACSDYNGPFTVVLSPHVGLTELVTKSGFKGKIVGTKCYMTSINETYSNDNDYGLVKGKVSKIFIPETSINWFFGFSSKEIFQFAKIIYLLNISYDFQVQIKKKKAFSIIEKYLSENYPSNNIDFLPPVRGLMNKLTASDIILTPGISSMAIKSSERYQVPYIIYDTSDNSINEWNSIYSNAEIKPYFAKNIEQIIQLLDNYK